MVLPSTGSSADRTCRSAQAGNSAAIREASGSARLAVVRSVDWPLSHRRGTQQGSWACLGLKTAGNDPATGFVTAMEGARILTLMMNQAIREAQETLGQFFWTWRQCNVNTVSIPHRDKNNVGLSIITRVGNCPQGELVRAGKLVDISHYITVLDGTQRHSSRPFSGDRYSVIALTHGVIDRVSDGQRK